MILYLLNRLAHSVVVFLGVIVVTFLIAHVLGDPVNLLLPPEATEQQRAYLIKDLGLDRPLHIQLLNYMANLVRGNFGTSFRHNRPVLGLLIERVPASLELALFSIVVSLLIAIPLGMFSAFKRDTIYDRIGMTLALFGQSFPGFWAGIMLILLFTVKLKWLPPSGRGGIQHMILPGMTLAMFCTAAIARLTRSCFLDILDADYIRMARLKGVPEMIVFAKHVFKNAFVTIFNITAIQFGLIFGSAVVVEYIFAWPGLGRLSLEAVYNRDYPVVLASIVTISCAFVLLNLAVDVVYRILDPRVGRN